MFAGYFFKMRVRKNMSLDKQTKLKMQKSIILLSSQLTNKLIDTLMYTVQCAVEWRGVQMIMLQKNKHYFVERGIKNKKKLCQDIKCFLHAGFFVCEYICMFLRTYTVFPHQYQTLLVVTPHVLYALFPFFSLNKFCF